MYVNDFHLGLFVVLNFIVSTLLNLDFFTLSFVFGVANLTLLFFSLSYFYKLTGLKPWESIISTFIFLFYTSSSALYYGAFFSLSDLFALSQNPSIAGLSLMLILIAFDLKENHFIKKSAMLHFILFLALFSIHILTAFVYVSIFGILVITDTINGKFNNKRIFYFIPYFLVFLIYLFWPLFNWFDFFVGSTPLQGSNFQNSYSVVYMLTILSVSFLGIPGLKKLENNTFFYLWSFVFILIIFSFLFPIRISSFWKFIPFLVIPLSAGLTKSLGNLSKRIGVFAVFCLIVLFLFYNLHNFNSFIGSKNAQYETLDEISKIVGKNSKVLADPFISHGLVAFGIQVYMVPSEHVGGFESKQLAVDRVNRWYDGCNFSEEELKKQEYVIISPSLSNCKKNIGLKLELQGVVDGLEVYKVI
jgi:hypothetical protein